MFLDIANWIYDASIWIIISFSIGFIANHFPEYFQENFRSFTKNEIKEIGEITYKISALLYIYMLFFLAHIVIKLVIIYFTIRIIIKKLEGADLSDTAENVFDNIHENLKQSTIFSQAIRFIDDLYEYHRKQLFASIAFLIFSYILFIQTANYINANDKIKNFTKITSNIVKDSSRNLLWQDTSFTPKLKYFEAFEYCKKLNLDGYNDWRIPRYQELLSIMDYDKRKNTFLSIFDYPTHKAFLSSDKFGDKSLYLANFSNATGHPISVARLMNGNEMREKSAKLLTGNNGNIFKNFENNYKYGTVDLEKMQKKVSLNPFKEMRALSVKCVKSIDKPNKIGYFRYTNHITNPDTKLRWQDTPQIRLIELNYKDAQKYCQELDIGGISSWRLPTTKELESIMDFDSQSGNIKALRHTINGNFWSTNKGNYSYTRKVIDFSSENIKTLRESKLARARCVAKPWFVWNEK